MGAVDCYFKAKYESRVLQKPVDLAFLIDLSSYKGLDLYNYELGLLKYSLDCYRASGTIIESYIYNPVYEMVDIDGSSAEVLVYPRAEITYIDLPDEVFEIGDEIHRLTLVRGAGGWKITSDSYESEAVLEYPPGTDFEALRAELAERLAQYQEVPPLTAVERVSRVEADADHLVYDRFVASNYAHRFALSYNTHFVSYQGSDCTNFASQCVWYGFGGIDAPQYIETHQSPMIDDVPGATDWWADSQNSSITWRYLPSFLQMLVDNAEKHTSGVWGMQGWLSTTIWGDLVVWDNPNITGPYDHVYLVCHHEDIDGDGFTTLNELFVCAHTADRLHKRLSELFLTPERLTFWWITYYLRPLT